MMDITPRPLESIGNNLVAIIGGSGINDNPLFSDARWYEFDTGYITLDHRATRGPDGNIIPRVCGDGKVYAQVDEQRGVIFIPRHGLDNIKRYGPSRTQYAANIITARRLGANCIIGISAVGSLRDDIGVASLVVPDDYIDESGRDSNLFGEGLVVHANPIPPFSEGLRKILINCAPFQECEPAFYRSFLLGHTTKPAHPFSAIYPSGVYVTIPGDSFGTMAEGKRRMQYAHIVGMTLCPEASMALQSGAHYACAAIPVDINLDANHEGKTIAVMRELSAPEKLPAYIARVVEQAMEFAKTAPPPEQLKGNIIPGNLDHIKNNHLYQIGAWLVSMYCQPKVIKPSEAVGEILDPAETPSISA